MNKPYQTFLVDNLQMISDECFLVIKDAGIPDFNDLWYIDKTGYDRFQNVKILRELMQDLQLYDFWFCTAVVVTYEDLPIHTDAGSFHYSFNIPIRNTENTYTTFYKSDQEPLLQAVPDGSTYKLYDNTTVEVIDKIEMKSPALINTQIPHNVIHNSKNFPRISILLRLNMSFNPMNYKF